MAAAIQAIENAKKTADFQQFPVIAAHIIYKGTPVFLKSATRQAYSNSQAAGFQIANGDIFIGYALETVDNSLGANGAQFVRVFLRDTMTLAITAAAPTDLGSPVFVNAVTANDRVTQTSSTGNPQATVGRIVEILSATSVAVCIDRATLSVVAAGA